MNVVLFASINRDKVKKNIFKFIILINTSKFANNKNEIKMQTRMYEQIR